MCDEFRESAYSILKHLRIQNFNKIIIGHLNVNSIRNKIHAISDLIGGKLDIFLVSETKLSDNFMTSQFFYKLVCDPLQARSVG